LILFEGRKKEDTSRPDRFISCIFAGGVKAGYTILSILPLHYSLAHNRQFITPVAVYLIQINDYGVHGQLSGRKRGLLLAAIPAILMDLRK
jgi:hypothetical protein